MKALTAKPAIDSSAEAKHYVQIIEFESGKSVKLYGPYPERKAEKMDSSLQARIDSEKYYAQMTRKPLPVSKR